MEEHQCEWRSFSSEDGKRFEGRKGKSISRIHIYSYSVIEGDRYNQLVPRWLVSPLTVAKQGLRFSLCSWQFGLSSVAKLWHPCTAFPCLGDHSPSGPYSRYLSTWCKRRTGICRTCQHLRLIHLCSWAELAHEQEYNDPHIYLFWKVHKCSFASYRLTINVLILFFLNSIFHNIQSRQPDTLLAVLTLTEKTLLTTVFWATPECDGQQIIFSKHGDIHSSGVNPYYCRILY